MADTISFILSYLETQNLKKAADVLREEIEAKKEAFPVSSQVTPSTDDADVDLVLRLSQDGAPPSSSSPTSHDSSTPPPQHSPSSLLPETRFSADSRSDRVSPTFSGEPDSLSLTPESNGSAGASPVAISPRSERKPLSPLPVAAPVASSSPEHQQEGLPQLRPVRLTAITKSPSSSSTKLQPLPEVETEMEGEDAPGNQDEDEGEGIDEVGSPEASNSRLASAAAAAEGRVRHLDGDARKSGGKSSKSGDASALASPDSATSASTEKTGGDSELSPVSSSIGVVPLAEVVVGSQVLGPTESGGYGGRKARGGVSQPIGADQEDAASMVSLSTDGALAASDAPDIAWDSDTYEDDDDPGYTRQPIEDEERFLLHEIDYPSEDDPLNAEHDALALVQAAKEKGGDGVEEKERGGGGEKGEKGQGGTIAEEETFFSGEEYYQQVHGEEDGLPDSMNEDGTWDGVLGELRDRKERPGRKGEKVKRGEEKGEEQEEGEEEEEVEDEDDHAMFEARSVGVSDMADAGSSIWEPSVLGSDCDADSVKGAPSGTSRSRLGRVGDDLEEEDGEDEEDEDEEEAEEGAPDDAGQVKADSAESAKKEDGQVARQSGPVVKASSSRVAAVQGSEFGFRSLSDAGSKPAKAGESRGLGDGGLGGGFSFPSPSSHDGLSRMGSGRSMFSSSEQEGKGLADLEAGEELEVLATAADDTLEKWKRHSATSSPILQSPTKKSSEGSPIAESLGMGGDVHLDPAQLLLDSAGSSGKKGSSSKRGPKEALVAAEKAAVSAADPELSTLIEPQKAAASVAAQGKLGKHQEASVHPEAPKEEVKAVDEAAKESKGGKDEEKAAPDQEEFETFQLKIIHRKNRTGFEEEKDFPVVLNSVIAGRYYVTEYLGSAAFSKAIQAHDLHTGMDVCLKIIKNNKDFFDQSLDEVKLLKFVNSHDPADEHHVLRLFDYFYHREHLFIICELLRANLYEFQKYNRDSGGEVYFTMPRLQKIAKQVLRALKFMHSLGLIHCDLKPENILIKSYSRCEVKVIDLGSSCFETDHLCTYVQSRSYRAPEVILGLPYGPKIDIWSLGCILAELCSGQVLFQNDSLATLLARVVGIIGPMDPQLLRRGRERHKFFTKNHVLYERNPETEQLEYLIPKRTTLRHRVPMGDPGFIEFISYLLQVDPAKRPTAAEALAHPWLLHQYDTLV